jgi:hypothetical protein
MSRGVADVIDDKVDHWRRIVQAVGMVAYPRFVNHFDFPTKLAVPPFNDGRILRDGHDIISIAHDVNNGDLCFGQWSEDIDRIPRVGKRFCSVMEMIAIN